MLKLMYEAPISNNKNFPNLYTLPPWDPLTKKYFFDLYMTKLAFICKDPISNNH